MPNKRKRSALDRTSTDPYTLGYKAGLTGQCHNSNPYTKDIPNSIYNSRRNRIKTFLSVLDPVSLNINDGVTNYHKWFCGWNDGVDKAESISRS